MNKVYAADYGIFPDKACNKEIVKMLCENKNDTHFIFENGVYLIDCEKVLEYEYYFSNSDHLKKRKIAFLLKNMKNILFDANGSEFLFNGSCTAFMADNCENITFQNFKIDRKIPSCYEGIVTNIGNKYFDIFVNKDIYPYEIKDNSLYLNYDNTPVLANGICVFDTSTKRAAYKKGDSVASEMQKELSNADIRFYCDKIVLPEIGNTIVLRNHKRYYPSIVFSQSKNIKLNKVLIHSNLGIGVLSQFCENIDVSYLKVVPNEQKGRFMVSGHDDGLQFVNAKGEINIQNCMFKGLMDDCVNIHGICVDVTKKINKNTFLFRFGSSQAFGFENWAVRGDIIRFIKKDSLSPEHTAVVEEVKILNEMEFELIFKDEIDVDSGFAIENITNTPKVICRNNHFGNGRARGVLISVQKSVLIEKNLFESSGSGILVAGDANFWFESGPCENLVIRKNVFLDTCLSSDYEFGKGIISICPNSQKPNELKPFHKNIKIEENLFYAFDLPIVYAFLTKNISVCNNIIIKSNLYSPYIKSEKAFLFEYCTDEIICNNEFVGYEL